MQLTEILVSQEMTTTSRIVAAQFKKPHHRVLHAISQLEKELENSQTFFRSRDYTDVRGKKQPEVEITRDGFSLLAMGFTGGKALQWKLRFIKAFNAMEAKLVKDSDKLEWKAARLGVKKVRKTFTDTVKNFVDYATKQGSQSAKMYYANITIMEYKALDLLERQKTSIGNFRDTLDIMDIAFLSAAEMVAKVAIEQGMEQKMHYKEIYIFAKQKVTDYANSVSFVRLAK
jgi:Rha family phage regulatory protein